MFPLSYLKIGLFLRRQNQKIGGIVQHYDMIKFCPIAITRNVNLYGRRRQKNIVSIAYNLVAWCLDVLGDLLGLLVKR